MWSPAELPCTASATQAAAAYGVYAGAAWVSKSNPQRKFAQCAVHSRVLHHEKSVHHPGSPLHELMGHAGKMSTNTCTCTGADLSAMVQSHFQTWKSTTIISMLSVHRVELQELMPKDTTVCHCAYLLAFINRMDSGSATVCHATRSVPYTLSGSFNNTVRCEIAL